MVGGKDKKSKCSPTSPSESFGHSEYSGEDFSDEESSQPPPPYLLSLDCDSMGLSPIKRAFIRAMEQPELTDSIEEEDDNSGGSGDKSGSRGRRSGNGGKSDSERSIGGSGGGGSSNYYVFQFSCLVDSSQLLCFSIDVPHA